MDRWQQTLRRGSTVPGDCTSSISWCGAPARPAACTHRRARAHGHLSPILLVATLTWGPLKKLFAFPEAGSVPDSPPVPCPRPGRRSSAVLQHPHATGSGSAHQCCGRKRLFLWLITQVPCIGLPPSLFSVLALTIHPRRRCSFVRTMHPSYPHGGKRPLGRRGYHGTAG